MWKWMGNIKKIWESNGKNLKLTLTFFVKLFWELHHKIHGYKKLYLYQKPKQIQPSLDLQIQVENFSSASSCFPPSLKKIQVSSVYVCLMLSDIFLNNNTIRVGVGPTSFLDFGEDWVFKQDFELVTPPNCLHNHTLEMVCRPEKWPNIRRCKKPARPSPTLQQIQAHTRCPNLHWPIIFYLYDIVSTVLETRKISNASL